MIIINLREGSNCLRTTDFEYDIQGVIRGFFPNVSTITNKTGEAFLTVSVDYLHDNQSVNITLIPKEQEELCGFISVDYLDRKETKNRLKRVLYNLLSAYTERTLPWGTLSGIRPAKIPVALLEQGFSEEYVRAYMKETYLTSDEKIELSIKIAKNELYILKDIDYKNGFSVYIGIPFCPSTCLYCSFTSYPVSRYKDKIDLYLEALFKEIDYVANNAKGRKLNTVYIGGGTPTTLEPHQLARLLDKIRGKFDFTHCKEFTAEAGRPDSITEEKLQIMKQFGVTRISVNPQTMKQETLDLIGRKHSVMQIVETFKLARKCGFDNINMDYIVGLPDETIEDVRDTMEQTLKLMPDSITIHSLAVKRAARLNTMKEQYGNYTFNNDKEIMKLTEEYAGKMDLQPYYLYRQKNIAGNMENVGYSTLDKAGIYNILIMEEKQTIMALGAGASTKIVFSDGISIERVENVKDVDLYIERIDEMIERKGKYIWSLQN